MTTTIAPETTWTPQSLEDVVMSFAPRLTQPLYDVYFAPSLRRFVCSTADARVAMAYRNQGYYVQQVR